MKYIEETDSYHLDNKDVEVIKCINEYKRDFHIASVWEFEQMDFHNIADIAKTKAGHVRAIVENIEID